MTPSTTDNVLTQPQRVAASLREDIIWGRRTPGSPIRESEVCQEFQVSRVTAREALRSLADDGLVELIPHHGAFVIHLNPRIAWEFHTMRALVEPYAVRLAMEQGAYSEKILGELGAISRRLGEAAERGDIAEAIRLEIEFHLQLCLPCGHSVLMQMLRSFQYTNMVCLVDVRASGYQFRREILGYEEIIAAIRTGDVAHAENVVSEHILAVASSALGRSESAPRGSVPAIPHAAIEGLGKRQP